MRTVYIKIAEKGAEQDKTIGDRASQNLGQDGIADGKTPAGYMWL